MYRGGLKSEVNHQAANKFRATSSVADSVPAAQTGTQLNCALGEGILKAFNLRTPSWFFLKRFDAENGGKPPVSCVNPLS